MSSHHLPNGRFRNIESPAIGKLNFLKLFAFLFRRMIDRKKVMIPSDHVLSEAMARSEWQAHQGKNFITWLGHASFLIHLDGITLLTDPFLTDVAGVWKLGPKRLVPSAISINHLPPIDIILVSHNHYDHLDVQAIQQLKKRFEAKVVVPLKLGRYFTKCGYSHIHELDWHTSSIINDIKITALPAIHYSRRGLFDKNKSLWASFMIESKYHRLYFSGDTAYGAHLFKSIGQKHGPFDLAILGIGTYEPHQVVRCFHCSPEEAVQIGIDLKAKQLLGMHWGTIILSEEPLLEPPVRFKKAAKAAGLPESSAWVMKIGESRAL